MSNHHSAPITAILAREILDSRGLPTVEVEVTLSHQQKRFVGTALVPSGASTGIHEALELRDQDPERYGGKGVLQAISHVNKEIFQTLAGWAPPTPAALDERLITLDGTPNKSRLGANALLGVSVAFARAMAARNERSLIDFLRDIYASYCAPPARETCLPVPLFNVVNGGRHANNGLAIQEFMIIPQGFPHFGRALQAAVEVYQRLKQTLNKQGHSTAVGDEGGFAPLMQGDQPHRQILDLLVQAITEAGYRPGKEIALALDVAASEFALPSGQYQFEGQIQTADQLIATYQRWVDAYPIVSIEDGLSQHDWAGWQQLTQTLGSRCQLVGDDLFVTQTSFLRKGIQKAAANAILIKLNQVGTLSETLETMAQAQQADWNCIVSHRSGETEDTFIADLAVATGAGQLKAGSVCRSERVAKFNQCLRLASQCPRFATPRYGRG